MALTEVAVMVPTGTVEDINSIEIKMEERSEMVALFYFKRISSSSVCRDL